MNTEQHIASLEHLIQLLTAELEESNQKFRRVVEESSDGIILTDEQGLIIEWNQAQEAITGLKRADAIDRPIWEVQFEFVPPPKRTPQAYDTLKTGLQQFFQTGTAPWVGQITENEILHHDGEPRTVQTSVFSIQTEHGVMAAAITRDVTRQKHNHEQLRKLWWAVEQSANSIIITDSDGSIEFVNAKCLELTGYTRDELIGRTPRIFRSGYTSQETYRQLWQTIKSGQEWRGEFYNKKKNGEYYWESAAISPIRDEAGNITHFIAVKEDITERKQVQETLRRREQEFRALVEHSPDIISRVDRELRYLYINPVIEQITGIPAEVYLGKTDAELSMDTRVVTLWQTALHRVFETGQEQLFEFSYDSPSGLKWFQTRMAPEFAADGTVETVLSISRDITQRKNGEQALIALEAFERSIVDSLSAHIAIVAEDGTIAAVNRAWADFAEQNGGTLEKVAEGANYFDVMRVRDDDPDAETARLFMAGIKRVLAGEQGLFRLEYPCHSRQEQRWFEGRVTRFDVNGARRLVIAHENITERKLAEQELQTTNEKLQLLNRIVSVAGSTLNVNNVLEEVCRELALFLGVPQAAAALIEGDTATVVAEYLTGDSPSALGVGIPVSGNPVYEYFWRSRKPLAIEDAQHDPLLAPVHGVMRQRGTVSLMVVPIFVREQLVGSIGFDTLEPHRFSKEEIETIAAAARAVSQAIENSLLHQSIAEHNARLSNAVEQRTQQLQRLNERISAILNSVSDSILLLQSDGAVNITNPAFDHQFGYLPDELFGQHIDVLASEPYQPILLRAVQQVLEDGEPRRLEFIARRNNGDHFDADMAIALVRNHETSLVCSIRDISYLKEVDRVKDNFISMVSHELRTPISVMTLISGGLRKYYDRMTEEQRLKKLDQIETQAEVLAELVESVLDVSRLEARKKQRGQDAVDMSEVTLKIVKQLQPDAEAKKQTLQLSLENSPILLTGDSVDFGRVWRNLINNAIKYTPEQGQIFVRLGIAHKNGHETIVLPAPFAPSACEFNPGYNAFVVGQVEDTGHGIHPEDFPYLFTRFYRGWAKQSGIPGTGLGLSLVRELLEIYGGGIHVTSQVNAGSVFTFWLPIEEGHQSWTRTNASPATSKPPSV